MLDKTIGFLKMPGYIEKREVRIEISEEDIFGWIRHGKLQIRSDGHMRVNGIIFNELADKYGEEAGRLMQKAEDGAPFKIPRLLMDLFKMLGYIEKREVKIDISEEEISEWIKQGKIMVRSDGYVEVVDGRILNEVTDRRLIKKAENG